MQPAAAKRTVLLAMVGTGAVAIIKAARAGQRPRVGTGIGTVLAAAGLTALADPAPDLAAGIASLSLLSVLLASPDSITAAGNALRSSHKANVGSLKTAGTSSAGTIAQLAAGAGIGSQSTLQLLAAAPAGATSGGSPTEITVGDGSSRPYTGYASNVPVDHYDTNGHPVPVLVPIDGRSRLAPVAAAAFRKLESAFGEPIVLTGGWRPIPAAGEGPTSRAPGAPIKASHYVGHHSGEAIDVSLGASGMDPYKGLTDPRRQRWERFVIAAHSTGWLNHHISGKDMDAIRRSGVETEWWHWSVNGRH